LVGYGGDEKGSLFIDLVHISAKESNYRNNFLPKDYVVTALYL
jgi:hypothetical protein